MDANEYSEISVKCIFAGNDGIFQGNEDPTTSFRSFNSDKEIPEKKLSLGGKDESSSLINVPLPFECNEEESTPNSLVIFFKYLAF